MNSAVFNGKESKLEKEKKWWKTQLVTQCTWQDRHGLTIGVMVWGK